MCLANVSDSTRKSGHSSAETDHKKVQDSSIPDLPRDPPFEETRGLVTVIPGVSSFVNRFPHDSEGTCTLFEMLVKFSPRDERRFHKDNRFVRNFCGRKGQRRQQSVDALYIRIARLSLMM